MASSDQKASGAVVSVAELHLSKKVQYHYTKAQQDLDSNRLPEARRHLESLIRLRTRA